MRYIVIGHRTEMDERSGKLGEIVSGHYGIVDAVRSMLRYTAENGGWYKCYVAKVMR